MINRQNYEIWFLDYSEGNLSNERLYQLYDFIDSNPDLKEEFESFEIFTLDKYDAKFEKKEQLKKNIDPGQIEGLDEFEILAIKKIENQITAGELSVLNHLLSFSTVRKNEFAAFEKTKLKADQNIRFEGKESLKKRSGIIRLIYDYSASIAAIGLLILFFSSIINTEEKKSSEPYASGMTKENSMPSSMPASDEIAVSDVLPLDDNIIIENNDQPEKNNKSTEHQQYPVKADNPSLIVFDYENPKEEIAESRISTYVRALNTGSGSINKSPRADYVDYSAGRKNEIASNDIGSALAALTPKQFLIKTVKNNLDINDDDYTSLKTMEVVSAAVDKTKLANLNYSKDEATDSREFAFSIGSLSFSRKWTRE